MTAYGNISRSASTQAQVIAYYQMAPMHYLIYLPVQCQAIIWTNAGLLKCECNGTLWTNFSEIVIKIQTFSFKKMHFKISSGKWLPFCLGLNELTHWGRVTHICISKLTIIASDNGLSPGRHQAIIWTSAGILLIGPLGTNFSEILIKIQTFSFKKMHLKISSGKWLPFCLASMC